MNSSGRNVIEECAMRYPLLRSQGVRSSLFFFNFFLVITTLYQLKPASRSLFIEHIGTYRLPYVWIVVAISMWLFVSMYHRLVSRFNRQHIVMGSVLVFGLTLLLFRFWFFYPSKLGVVCFYVFVDILGVVLVEQFWSLVNSVYSTREGKSWYGLIGTGGLLGGVTGGTLAALLIKYTPIKTQDLVISAAITLFIILTLTFIMGRLGLFCEVNGTRNAPEPDGFDKPVAGFRRYLILIAAILLLSQLLSPVIEYQFMGQVESTYADIEARTMFLSMFFSLLSAVSIGVNLLVTPFIHRRLGPIAGLLAQPLVIMLFAVLFLFQPTLFLAAATRIGDRGLSYSINRASRELLYIPIGSLLIYRAKAWIDMLGYRLFKVLGSAMILIVTGLVHESSHIVWLGTLTILAGSIWILMVGVIGREYESASDTV